MEFRQLNVGDWDEPGSYDAVYSRFLLHHLSRPVDLLGRMWAAVRPGGVLIAEDADFGGWCCHPPNEGFHFFLRTYGQVLQRSGGDHAFGASSTPASGRGHSRAPGDPGPAGADRGGGKDAGMVNARSNRETILSEGLASEGDGWPRSRLRALHRRSADPYLRPAHLPALVGTT